MGFVRKADGRALLASHGSDGTPLVTRQHWRHKTGSLGDVHRHGNSSHEYLIQRCFSHTVRMGRPSWIRSSRSRYLWRVARTRCSCSIARACFSPRSEGRAIRAWLCNTFASIAVATARSAACSDSFTRCSTSLGFFFSAMTARELLLSPQHDLCPRRAAITIATMP